MTLFRHPVSSYILLAVRVFALSVLLSGCFPGVYKLDIPQGNVLEEEKIDQLKAGMTKRQVRYILGTPMVMDSFDQDHWAYYYSHKYYRPRDSEGTFYEARLELTFDKGILTTIKKDIPKTQEVENEDVEKKKEDIDIPEAAE